MRETVLKYGGPRMVSRSARASPYQCPLLRSRLFCCRCCSEGGRRSCGLWAAAVTPSSSIASLSLPLCQLALLAACNIAHSTCFCCMRACALLMCVPHTRPPMHMGGGWYGVRRRPRQPAEAVRTGGYRPARVPGASAKREAPREARPRFIKFPGFRCRLLDSLSCCSSLRSRATDHGARFASRAKQTGCRGRALRAQQAVGGALHAHGHWATW
jgi:hypothetical protein